MSFRRYNIEPIKIQEYFCNLKDFTGKMQPYKSHYFPTKNSSYSIGFSILIGYRKIQVISSGQELLSTP